MEDYFESVNLAIENKESEQIQSMFSNLVSLLGHEKVGPDWFVKFEDVLGKLSEGKITNYKFARSIMNNTLK